MTDVFEVKNWLNALPIESNTILLFDHQLGGGSNDYRQRKVKYLLEQGHSILMALSIHNVESEQVKLVFIQSKENIESINFPAKMLFENIQECVFQMIFVNSIVSFKPATLFIKHFKQFIHQQPNTCFVEIAVHDYYLICPSHNLLNYQQQYCGVPNQNTCKNCQRKHPNTMLHEDDAQNWRKYWQVVLRKANKITVFSQSSQQILTKAFFGVEEKIVIEPHTMEYFKAKPLSITPHQGINVGIVGNILPHKGQMIVEQLAKHLSKQSVKVNLVVIGQLNVPDKLANIRILGRYQPQDLSKIIESQNIDVFLFPSICPETFSYVVEELMLLQQKIVCFDLGAQGEKIRNYSLGQTVHISMNSNELTDKLLAFYLND